MSEENQINFYMSKKELAFWIKSKVLPVGTKFGDMCYGAVLVEVKKLRATGD